MPKNNFETLSKAMAALREKGYEKDLTEDILNADEDTYFITAAYRFEGMTNPSDSSVLYAIESKSGEKGIIVDSYGAKSDSRKTKALEKLKEKS